MARGRESSPFSLSRLSRELRGGTRQKIDHSTAMRPIVSMCSRELLEHRISNGKAGLVRIDIEYKF